DAVSAEKEIRKALELGMSPDKAMVDLAQALLAQGQFQKVLDEAKPGSSPNATLDALRGNAFLSLGKISEARAAFEQAQKTQADLEDAMLGLAKVAFIERDADGALRQIEQTIA